MSHGLTEQQLEGLIGFAETHKSLAFGRISLKSSFQYYYMWYELARNLNYMTNISSHKGAVEYQRIWSQIKIRTRSKVTKALRQAKLKGEKTATVYLTEAEKRIYNMMPNNAHVTILDKADKVKQSSKSKNLSDSKKKAGKNKRKKISSKVQEDETRM